MKKFMAAYEEAEERKHQQQKLHTKHNIKDDNVIVVEKSNMLKFSVQSIGNVIRITATAVLLCLAAVGLMCIIYPETRHPLQMIIRELVNQLIQYVY